MSFCAALRAAAVERPWFGRALLALLLALAFPVAPLPATVPAAVAYFSWDQVGGDDVAVVLADVTPGTSPVLDIAENGDIYVAVSVDLTGQTAIYLYRSQDGGDHWSYWGAISVADAECTEPSLHIAEGESDLLYVAYKYRGAADLNSQIRVSYSALSTASWTTHTALSAAGEIFSGPCLTSDEMNFSAYRLYLVAMSSDGNGTDIWFTRSTNYGFSWEAGYEIAALSTGDHYLDPVVCYGRSGGVHCAWYYHPVSTTGRDDAARYRHAANYAAGGIADWDPIQYLSSSLDTYDEIYVSVAASHGSDKVVVSWTVLDGASAFATDVTSSPDAGATWDGPVRLETQVTSQLLAWPGTGGFSMGGDWFAAGHGFRQATDSNPLSWSDQPIIADRRYHTGWSSPACSRGHDYDLTRENRLGLIWLATNAAGADTVFFDAEWRRDPGYANLEEGFPLSLSSGVVAPPAICELDGDMESEIVFGDVTGHIIALNHDGTAVPGWPVDIGTFQRDATIAVGDINDDQYNEVVAGNNAGYIYAFDHSGVQLSGWPRNTGTAAPAYVAIGAISTANRQVAACSGAKVFLYNGSGSPVPDFPMTLSGNVLASPAIGDVDGDGDREIVLLQEHFMNVIRGNATVQAFRNVTADGHTFTNAPTLADLNLDGDLEIMAPSDQGRLYVMNPDGTNYPGWPYTDPAGIRLTSVAAAQIRSGTEPELIFGVEDATAPEVHAFYEYGTELGGYPNPTGAGWYLYGMPIVDVLDEGSADVIAASRDKKGYAWTNFGSDLPGWPEDLGARCEVSAASGDIDADGNVEVVFTTYDPPSVVIYDLGASVYRSSFYNTYWWPMYGYNPLRQGCLACDNDRVTDVPGDGAPIAALLFAAPTPNPASGPVSLRFELPEAAAVRLECFDVQGRLVARVLKDELDAGPREIVWNPRDQSGPLASGVYYLRFKVSGPTTDRELTRRIVVAR